MNLVAEIFDNLFLGSAAARTKSFLKDNDITLVINAEGDNPSLAKCYVTQYKINAKDHPTYNLSQHFDDVADKIKKETTEKNGKVYIHCIGGISRAPSLTLAYLMKHEKMTLVDAHELVKSKRTFVRPNLGFWKQLIDYELKLFGSNTVTVMNHGKTEYASVYAKDYQNMVT
ncbi:dual specificity protein phosphatase 18-like [Clytia hemisphaerica]|uniref:dual specificity protein phosphatase 18-like n=1 Tax=Clytia hemisphaerica TaxID=252671 RepID=UPI0034D6A326